jgi:hypothetical protein
MREAPDNNVRRPFIHKVGAERRPVAVAACVGEFISTGAKGGERVVFVWHCAANARKTWLVPAGMANMLQKRNRRRHKRVSVAQMVREIGPRAHRAFRHARVGLWRFKRSPEQQDRASMIATFAFIGVFALGSVDAIVTGGADFGIGSAYASEMPAATSIVRPQPTVQAPVVVEALEETAPKKGVADENIDYSYTTEELLGGPLLTIADDMLPEEAVMGADKLVEADEPAAAIASEDSVL